MNTPLSEYLDFSQIEKKYGLRVDALRRAARLGRLKTTQVGGQFGCHFVLVKDVEAYLCEFLEVRVRNHASTLNLRKLLMSEFEQKALIELKRIVSILSQVQKDTSSIDQSLKDGDLQNELRDFRSDFRPELKRSSAVRQKLERDEKRKKDLKRIFAKSAVTTG